MDCESTQKLISLYLAGDIGGDDLKGLMAHLASCPECRAAFEEAKRYEAALKGVFRETVSKSRSPKSRVLRRIEAQGPGRPRGISLANWFVFIILMTVLCFLIIIAYVSYEKVRQENIEKSQTAKALLILVSRALKEYRGDYDAYPVGSNADFVRALQSGRKEGDTPYYKFRGRDISEGRIIDPWGREYVYKSTGEAVLIYSAGPNRIDENGLNDDIRP